MKHILSFLFALTLFTTASAQRYTTSSVSVYKQLYSNKYTLVETNPNAELVWEVTDEAIYRNSLMGPENWTVKKVIRVGKNKKYMLDAWDVDIIWLIVEGNYVYLYENNGQTKRAFRIIKREALRALSR
jgi:hypothetical protein